MMTQATASASDRRALLVGEEAYVAAGGRVERDLFSDDSSARWLDIALLERLAAERMNAIATELQTETGFAFVRPTLDRWLGYDQLAGLQRLEIERPPLTDKETRRLEELETELEALSIQFDDEELDDDRREAAEARYRELNGAIAAIHDRPPVVGDDLKGTVGVFLMLGDDGQARLDGTYYVAADENETGDGDSVEAEPAAGSMTAVSKPKGLSQRLVDELSIQRRDILAVHVAADPALALDLAIFLMVDTAAGHGADRAGSSLRAAPPLDPVIGFERPDALATRAAAEAADALDRSWCAGSTRGERFDAFRALGDCARSAWLGHAVARSLEASLNLAGDSRCAFHDHLGRLLDIDVAGWWRPTGANFFDRVPKAMALAALEEVGGTALAERFAKAKKAELAQSCERIFAGDVIAEAEVKAAALAWVPDPMRFGCGNAAATGDTAAQAGDNGTSDEVVGASLADAEELEEAA